MFAQEYPLSVSLSITFEQSYTGVDGDSAHPPSLRGPVQPVRVSHPPGALPSPVRESERPDPVHRAGSTKKSKGFSMSARPGPDRGPGRHDPFGQCQQPDAQKRRGRGRGPGTVPHLAGVHHRAGHRGPDRGAGRAGG